MVYAAKSEVHTERSKVEIERILVRYGAESFMYAWSLEQVTIGFRLKGRMMHLSLVMPSPQDDHFIRTRVKGMQRTPEAVAGAFKQAVRQRWRVLALVIKAKLEAIDAGVVSFEDEFLAYTMLPSGDTVGEWLEPQLQKALSASHMPKLLPGGQDEGRNT